MHHIRPKHDNATIDRRPIAVCCCLNLCTPIDTHLYHPNEKKRKALMDLGQVGELALYNSQKYQCDNKS